MADVTKGIMKFYREVKAEMKKVTWPTREQVTQYTTLILVLIASMTLIFWLADSLFVFLLRKILGV
ncbi:preprotein translocase subunit SecE [Caldanaerobius fijiensis DSM 17918]|uniref:Protein translocase subunit SecE n=1 Tax=Caldanaerobius fijiensis DSM 17918 TaxID=1121256 RepID=A0A1M5ETG7_9THEO|nr:preprotein translocase subunit SecE [Caldanaerobius fijiensis]SHF82507.1 preprotein translocase subunit SecE [Caldanaerobius fijiensis DSM 17918]